MAGIQPSDDRHGDSSPELSGGSLPNDISGSEVACVTNATQAMLQYFRAESLELLARQEVRNVLADAILDELRALEVEKLGSDEERLAVVADDLKPLVQSLADVDSSNVVLDNLPNARLEAYLDSRRRIQNFIKASQDAIDKASEVPESARAQYSKREFAMRLKAGDADLLATITDELAESRLAEDDSPLGRLELIRPVLVISAALFPEQTKRVEDEIIRVVAEYRAVGMPQREIDRSAILLLSESRHLAGVSDQVERISVAREAHFEATRQVLPDSEAYHRFYSEMEAAHLNCLQGMADALSQGAITALCRPVLFGEHASRFQVSLQALLCGQRVSSAKAIYGV